MCFRSHLSFALVYENSRPLFHQILDPPLTRSSLTLFSFYCFAEKNCLLVLDSWKKISPPAWWKKKISPPVWWKNKSLPLPGEKKILSPRLVEKKILSPCLVKKKFISPCLVGKKFLSPQGKTIAPPPHRYQLVRPLPIYRLKKKTRWQLHAAVVICIFKLV